MKLAQAMQVCIIIVILAGLVIVWNPQNITGLAVSTQSEVVRFGYVPAPFNAIPIVALRKGFFAQEGLTIHEVRTSFVGYIFQQLVTNDIDVLTGAETPGVFIALKSSEFNILATHEQNTNDLVLVSKKQTDITSIADLKDKKVGFPFTSVAHFNLWKLLKQQNLSLSDVNAVDLAPQNMASALEHGDVDAFFIWEPVASVITNELGEKVTALTPESTWMMNVYESKQFSKRKGTEKKVLRALIKAEKFIKENPVEAIAIVAKETSLDEETLAKQWNKWKFKLTEFTEIDELNEQAKWAIEEKLVTATSVPNFNAMINAAPLREIIAES